MLMLKTGDCGVVSKSSKVFLENNLHRSDGGSRAWVGGEGGEGNEAARRIDIVAV